jgi:hypothetical protein
MTEIKVVAIVVDVQQIILYKADGDKEYIPQGDPRIRGIIDKAMPILNAGGVATVSLEHHNEYAAFEKKTSGLVRFFRVAKAAVAHLLGSDEEREPIKPMAVGKVPVEAVPVVQTTTNPVKRQAVEEIMSQAVPVTSSKFQESKTTEDETMMAVVGSGAQAKIVPGVEALKGQMTHANKLGSGKGVTALIQRLSAVIEKRGHSVQDVLKFMEKGDLPVADDGSIIAYKVLKNKPGVPGTYLDCHTSKVPQKVGSYVCMDESLVDRNRSRDCSNGLHIARRGYLRGFSGDACVLVKIAPEDVIAVPHGDANKVRVCGYHILSLIPQNEFDVLRQNRPMTDSSECQRLLGQAISGQHVGRLEQVQITQQSGGGIIITPLLGGQNVRVVNKIEAAPAVALDDKTTTTSSVDPKAISQANQEQKAKAPVPAPKPSQAVVPSRKEAAATILARMLDKSAPFNNRREAAEDMVALKKKAKVAYRVLGLTLANETTMLGLLSKKAEDKPEPAKAPAPKAMPAPKATPHFTKTTSVPPIPVDLKPAPEVTKNISRRDEAQNLYLGMMDRNWNEIRRADFARKLLDFKKKAKVSWTSLGLSEETPKVINSLLGGK